MTIETINPTTGKVIKTYQELSSEEITAAIDKTQHAFLAWSQLSLPERAKKMLNVAELLIENKAEYGKVITNEMGKLKKAAESEIEKCAWVCKHYATHAGEYLKPRIIKTEMQKTYVAYQPLGIILAIMPWNFPFWQVFRFAAPTLMAGNGALLKHAPISTGAGLTIQQLFLDAGFPKYLFQTLILSNEGAKQVIKDGRVSAVTLTGSGRAGRVVGSEAASALKRIVLELGGSDPYVILHDADVDKAVEACVASRLNNTGQVCIAAKRVIVVDAIRDEFKRKILEKVNDYVMGDPNDDNAKMGPMARKDLRDEVHKQVQESINKGATLVMGGKVPDNDGFYYPATILTDVCKGMPAYDEEIFGPVIALISAKDEEEAINIANDTQYGLAAAVFTQDIERGEKIAAEKIQAGACAVNTLVASDPRLPFGGIKESGYGRELSAEGIRSFTNVKTIIIK